MNELKEALNKDNEVLNTYLENVTIEDFRNDVTNLIHEALGEGFFKGINQIKNKSKFSKY